MQELLPAGDRDSWIKSRFTRKVLDINSRYWENPDEVVNEFGHSILHRLPYMLLISLPLFAFILKLVYWRRKRFYFADHGVFTIHLYVFTFLQLILIFTLNELSNIRGFGFLGFVIGLMFFALLAYLYMAMKNFYGQGWFKTFLKWVLVVFTSGIMMIVLFLLIMFFSAVTL